MLISRVKVLNLPMLFIKCHSCLSTRSYNSWLWVEICPAVKKKRPHSLEFNSIWTRHGLMTPVQRISLRLTTMMNRRKTGSLGYVHFNGSLRCRRRTHDTDSVLDFATLYYAEHVHIAQTRMPTPQFCIEQESEFKSIRKSASSM